MSVKQFVILCCCSLAMIATGCRSQTENIQQTTSTTQQSSHTQTASTNMNGPAAASNVPVNQNVSVNQNVPAQNANTNAALTAASFDPCSLITRAEVASVQGEEVTETKASPGNSTRLAVSQCFYQTTTPSKSVSLEVTNRLQGKPGALSPREFWEERFERADPDREREERKREGNREADKRDARANEEEEEGPPPRRINGVGEEAYWAGNRMVGALYVLKGNAIIRISIGGVADQNVRLEKTKDLARMALKRLNE
jgi:hypothetical protein